MRNYKTSTLVLILTPFVFSFAFGLDIYIPIVPQMAQILDTSPSMIQLTLSLFLFVTGIGQLLIGPFSDQFGRRTIFYIAAICFALGSLACVFSTNVYWLIAARVISAVGACGMLVNSFALVRDLFSKNESAKMFSFLNGAVGISPTFGPIIGGHLAVYFGWQSIFIFLTLIGLLALFITQWVIRETHAKENRIKFDQAVFKRYWHVLCNRQFLVYAMMAGFAEGVFFCFFLISPFILIERLHIPTHQFGYYFAIFGLAIALGGFASGKIVEKAGIPKTVLMGIALMFAGGIAMLVWDDFGSIITLQGFLIPMAAACTGAMFLVGGSASAALEPFGAIAGTASAAFGALEFGLSAIVGALLMLIPVNSTLPYAVSIILMGFCTLSLFLMRNKSTEWESVPIEISKQKHEL